MAKYYAIKSIDGELVNKIYTSWDECKEKVSGHNSIYKSFKTQEQAEEYLGNAQEEIKEHEINDNNVIYYVDGSYMNDVIGWGWVKVKNGKQIGSDCGGIKPTQETSRNITGELQATMFAVKNAVLTGVKDIYIGHDYQGISCYVRKEWKPKSKESVAYTKWMLDAIKTYNLNIQFFKIKGHTGNEWNEVVDKVAKLGTEVI